MATIVLYPRNKSYQYQGAKDADVILAFPLFIDNSLTREGEEAWEERAVIEGLWVLFLGTFTKNEAYNEVRERWGLFSPGPGVRGGNGESRKGGRGRWPLLTLLPRLAATRCFEQPEKRIKIYKGIHELL